MGSLSLLQGIFPTQGSNPGLPHCRRILYHLSHQGSIHTSIILILSRNLKISENISITNFQISRISTLQPQIYPAQSSGAPSSWQTPLPGDTERTFSLKTAWALELDSGVGLLRTPPIHWHPVLRGHTGKVCLSSPQPFRHWGRISWKTIFPWTRVMAGGEGGWFQDDSSALLLLCTLFLL